MGLRGWAAAFSLVLLAGSLAYGVYRGKDNFGVDFTGGQQLSLEFAQKASAEDLRDALTGAGLVNPSIQYQRSGVGEEKDEVLVLKVASPEEGAETSEGATAQKVLATQFADNGYRLLQEDTVGPQVGRELQKSGLMAIGLSLVGIIIYITIRFEFSFAIGSVVGLLHNVLITIGIYALLGRQLTMTSIAALLTVLGYSVNDTIVVFDRIRETRKLRGGRLDVDVVNESVNATLSRTLLTSVTTLLSVGMLMLFGAGEIFDFALAIFIGVIAGTYASAFIAAPVMLAVRPKAVAVAPRK